MNNKSLQRTRILGMVILGAVTAIIWILILQPRFAEPTRIRVAISESGLQAQMLTNQIGTISKQIPGLPDVAVAMSGVSAKYPANQNLSEIYESVYASAAKAGMARSQITNIRVEDPQLAEAKSTGDSGTKDQGDTDVKANGRAISTARMQVQIRITGSLTEITQLTGVLRTAPRPLTIMSVELSPSNNTYAALIIGEMMLLSPAPEVPDTTKLKKTGQNSLSITTPTVTPSPTVSATPTATATAGAAPTPSATTAEPTPSATPTAP